MAPSFRREASLQECLEQARLHVKAVHAEADDPESSGSEKQAREAAALAYQRRCKRRWRWCSSFGAKARTAAGVDDGRRGARDEDGRRRLSTCVQRAAGDGGRKGRGPRTIVGVRVINVGSDVGSITPMLEDIERRTGQLPATLLADGGHLKFDCLREAAARGVNVTCVVLAAAAGVGLGASGRARPKRDPGKVWTAKAGQTSSRTPADSIYALAVGLDGRRA